jgi:preprotein translocase subunit SecF
MFQILGKTQIDFISRRKYAFLVSGLLILIGLLAVIQIYRGQANLGIDFAGGTAVQLKFENPVRIENARSMLEDKGFLDAELQEFTRDNKLLIRVKELTTIEQKVAQRIVQAFEEGYSDNQFVVDSSTEIGPTIGKKLQRDALVAIAVSMIGIILYIALRFEFRFGIAAAIATFHDVLAVLGIFYLLDKEINLLLVTALLTLAGYSLTDTVVVFDRIRENLRQRRRDPLERVINNGINQVLSRTIVVSLTTILAVTALYLFGGEVIHDFSLALLLGVMVGTYSSIFVASPILIYWKGHPGKLLKRA